MQEKPDLQSLIVELSEYYEGFFSKEELIKSLEEFTNYLKTN
jgi:hemerythrin